MASDASKHFSQLSNDFNRVVEDLKNTTPLVEDLVTRAGKLQRHFDATSSALMGFLDAVQKIADVAAAASGYGGATDLGTCLTKIAIRHRAIAEQYTALSGTIGEELCKNLVTRMDLRRKALLAVEKEHDKDYKKWKVDLKKRNDSNLKLASKVTAKKKSERNANIHEKLEESLEDSVELYEDFQTFEQSCLRKALLEERKHYCAIVLSIAPVMGSEVGVLDEVYHLQELTAQCQSLNCESLPAHSEQAVNNLQLDITRLFKEAPCQSPALAQARKANQLKRNSFLSLASDALSMDSVSLGSSLNPTIASDGISTAAVSDGTDVSSPSLNAVRLDPVGCTGGGGTVATLEPTYADIDTMQDMCTPPVGRHQFSAAHSIAKVAPPPDAHSMGSASDLQSVCAMGPLANQPINPFGRPTADDNISLASTMTAQHLTLNRTSAKESLAQLARVIPPVAPKPPSRTVSQLKVGDEALYATAGEAEGDWPSPPPVDDLPSPPPPDDLEFPPDNEPLTPKQVPPPVLSRPPRQKAFAENRLSQSLDVLYNQTRSTLAHKKSDVAAGALPEVDEFFPPPPPPDEGIYDEVHESSAPITISNSHSTGDMAASLRHPAPIPASVSSYSVVHKPSPPIEHKTISAIEQSLIRQRSGSTDSAYRNAAGRLPVMQPQQRQRSTSRPLDPSAHQISMDV